MTTFIKINYFLLLTMKKMGESLNQNANDLTRLKETKEKLVDFFQQNVNSMPLAELTKIYEIFSLGLPAKETDTTLITIDEALIEAEIIPEAKEPEFNPEYISLETANNAFNTLKLNSGIDNINPLNIPEIKYQDLGWTRKERNEKLRRAEYGNTNTFEQISHAIKRAMMSRLYTLYKKNLPAEIYNQYLEIMKNNHGHQNAFWRTNSEAYFLKNFNISQVEAPIALPKP